jgi:hypothetical protein
MGIVTIAHLLLGHDTADDVLYAGEHFDSWLISMMIAGFASAAIVVSLIFADVSLLALKWRKLPTGAGAWLSSMLAPVALHFTMQFFSGAPESMLELVLRIVLPFPVSALLVRFALGSKP